MRKCIRPIRSLLFVVLFALCSLQTNAQFNDSVFHHAGVFSTGSLNQTDANSAYLLNNVVKYGIKKKSYGLTASGGWTYGEQNAELTNNDINTNFLFDVNSSVAHLNYWGLANYQSSFSLKINNQYQGGAGLAFDLIDRKQEKLNVSNGLLYESNDINTSDTTRLRYNTLRNSLKLQFSGNVMDRVSINGSFFYQNSFNDGKDYIVKANLTLLLQIRKWLNFTATYAYNRVNITNKENSLFTYGITVEKYY